MYRANNIRHYNDNLPELEQTTSEDYQYDLDMGAYVVNPVEYNPLYYYGNDIYNTSFFFGIF